jgi:hypothetical protein
MIVDLKVNEIVTKAGNARFFAPEAQVKGKLILTNQRLYFKTLEETYLDYNMEILPTDIRELMFFKTKLILQNGLSLVTKNGLHLKFSVKNRDAWNLMINKLY